MTLDEFQKRMKEICAAHVVRAKAAQEIFGNAINELAKEANGLMVANEAVAESIMRIEIEAMLKEIG